MTRILEPLSMWRSPSNGAPRHHILPLVRSRKAALPPTHIHIPIPLHHLRHKGRRSRSGSIPCRDASVPSPEAARATAGGLRIVTLAKAATITPSHTQSPIPHHHAYIPAHSHLRSTGVHRHPARVFVITYMLRVINADSKKKKKKNSDCDNPDSRVVRILHLSLHKLDVIGCY
ncbi:hypothetical protein BJV78DRAFT_746045 [Lactifluus subvellereus]|nr:hypothetical protein BJV78DRAFT_746045 [Lactifluus subvellereus]